MLHVDGVQDPADLLSWRIDGREPTADEVRLLHSLTVEDALDVSALHQLDLELTEAVNDERWGGEA
jgi:hypothetical protein